MKKLVACIKSMTAFGLIKTRFFYLDEEKGKVRDVTLELCAAIGKFNRRAEEIQNAIGAYSLKIPYAYRDGIAEYSHGCGLTHYLQEKNFEDIKKVAGHLLSFPLMECKISSFVPYEVKDILGCKGVFDSKIEDSLLKYYCKVEFVR